MNQTYKITGPNEFASEDTTEEALAEARKKATELLEAGSTNMRTCWNCNGAHAHMIEWDDILLACFSCGHYYLGGVDVTELES